MNFELSPESQQFQQEVRELIQRLATPEALEESLLAEGHMINGPASKDFYKRLLQTGLLTRSWPIEHGGQGGSATDQWILMEELCYSHLPFGDLTTSSIGPTIARVGTEEQKREYLPGILNGDIIFGAAYTEPDAGSDIASLRTRAVRDGDYYVINGHKAFCSAAHYATHLWLACRTSADLPKHKGLSILIVPIDEKGITIRPTMSQAGYRSNDVFLDSVRTPASGLIGEENGGWRVMMMAMDFERILFYSHQRRRLDDLVEYVKTTEVDGEPLIHRPKVRRTMAKLVVDLEVARLLALNTVWLIEQGTVPTAEASMVKIWVSEFRERIANSAIDMLGPQALLRAEEPEAPIGGDCLIDYLHFPVLKFAGGTNQIQRNIIAQRGLGLPLS